MRPTPLGTLANYQNHVPPSLPWSWSSDEQRRVGDRATSSCSHPRPPPQGQMAPLLNRAWVTAALGLGVNEDYRSNPDTKQVALQSFIVNREQAASRRFATKVEEDEKRTAPLASSSSSSSSSPSLLGFDALGENAPIRRLVGADDEPSAKREQSRRYQPRVANGPDVRSRHAHHSAVQAARDRFARDKLMEVSGDDQTTSLMPLSSRCFGVL